MIGMGNILRKRLEAGERLLGTQIDLSDYRLGEILGEIGFDFLWVEMEHVSTSVATMEKHLIAARAAGTPCLVRVPWNDIPNMKHVLETGPDGIVVPQVNSVEEARYAIENCIYPPEGKRGYGPCRAARYGLDSAKEYIEHSKDMCRFLQIESKEAVADMEEMCQIPYVDGFVIGPMDLSGSVDELGDIMEGKETNRLIDLAIQKAHDNGKVIGLFCGAGGREELEHWIGKGIDFLSAGSDICSILKESCDLLCRMKTVSGKYPTK